MGVTYFFDWCQKKTEYIYSGTIKHFHQDFGKLKIIPMQKLNIDISMQIVTVAVHILYFHYL